MSDERVDRGHPSVLKSAAATAAEAMLPVGDVHEVDHSRRRLLTAATAGIGAGCSFSIHSIMICTSRSSPRRWNRRLPAFFMAFQLRSGSIAIIPSAMDRQRRSATRKSCTGSAPKSAATWSHSSSTRSIQ